MSSATEEGALEDLVAVVKRAEGLEVVDEEPTDVRNGMATVHCVGGTPTEFQLRVTVYARGGSPRLSQKMLRQYRVAIEDSIRTHGQSQFGPSQWTYDWIPETDIWQCTFELTTGREDV